MKRTTVVVALAAVLLVAASASAQDDYKQALRYELKAGLVSTYQTTNNYNDTGIGWGYQVGGGLFLPLFTKGFGLMAEVYYVNKEASITLAEAHAELPAADGNEIKRKITPTIV